MRIHPLTTTGSTKAPALPDASRDAPKPRLSAYELVDLHLSVFRVCFGCKVAYRASAFLSQYVPQSISRLFLFAPLAPAAFLCLIRTSGMFIQVVIRHARFYASRRDAYVLAYMCVFVDRCEYTPFT